LQPDDPRSVGDYQLVSRLGAGGMGQVYLGTSPGGRRVAVKVVYIELAQLPEFHSRFRREVLANRLVSGAYTAPVIDADSYAPQPWLATSYIPGPSLGQAVKDLGPLPVVSVTALAAALAEALHSIHDTGLVHRDLKPSNVLLAEDGPRVIDFGIARVTEATKITRTGDAMGSPGYMSPEQAVGGEITPASDIFSLGALLAYTATGTNPFGDGPFHALSYRVVHTEPDLDAITDPALRSLIADCLSKAPEQRPTPKEILDRAGYRGGTTTLLDTDAWLPVARRVRVSDEALAVAGKDTQVATEVSTHVLDGGAGRRGSGAAKRPFATRRTALLAILGISAAAAGVVATTDFLQQPAEKNAGKGSSVPPSPSRTAPRKEVSDPADAAPTKAGIPDPVGVWPLDEGSGAVARDGAGDKNGQMTAVEWRNGEAWFNGESSQIVAPAPPLTNGPEKNYTVSARVLLQSKPQANVTAVSQVSGGATAYFLMYSQADDSWAFAIPGDGFNAVAKGVPVRIGDWTHLAGVRTGNELRIYVDGQERGSVVVSEPTRETAEGDSLFIGRARVFRSSVDWFPGAIKDVRIFNQALGPSAVEAVASQ
jgi:hypothetical protein